METASMLRNPSLNKRGFSYKNIYIIPFNRKITKRKLAGMRACHPLTKYRLSRTR